ncbi:lipopolysaccharide biosynthesis protein [Novosphingobium sp. 1949]|uniref:Lipopolysaccharide biosynthesis protein n=1 Tax=Novosphingobium organovorum TaxID=2930092 RepID=A0ABT0BCD9_9SPHN|nr:lipopolysaccharide biosynthesis protein [Novosphingobium organovorum]MCJ2182727.1 lipopolysaccharide biosynthesis protein [Novosphingobium organovorum]
MSETANSPGPAPSTARRILRNTAWLLGGKGFGGLCSLIYLAILSRSLGVKHFGHFSLIFGTAQALVAIAGFQTWQAVVRYGAAYVHDQDWQRFTRLSMLCGLIDVVGGVLGCGIALVVFLGFSHQLSLNPAYVTMALAFNCALMWGRVSAPTGIMRALNRFDMAVYVEAMVPVGRLIAAGFIWWYGPTVGRFLFAWATIDIASAIAYWIIALRQIPERSAFRGLRQWRKAVRDNPGIGHFLLVTSGASTLDAVYKQGPLLAVGFFLGTKAAGIYRLADQLAQGFSKLSTLLARAIYPEVTRARVAASVDQFRRMVKRINQVAGLAGGFVVLVAIAIGGKLLALIGGEPFKGGDVVLVPLAVAASFGLASVAFEPVLHSTGRARQALVGRVISVIMLALAIGGLNGLGAIGIAWAVALAAAAGYVALGVMAYRSLRKLPAQSLAVEDGEEPLPPAAL